MPRRVDEGLKLKYRVKTNWDENDMVYLEYMAKDLGISVSEFIRETIRQTIIDEHHRMIPYYPPTKQLNELINHMVTETGLTRSQLVANILTFHITIVKAGVLDEELLHLLLIRFDSYPPDQPPPSSSPQRNFDTTSSSRE